MELLIGLIAAVLILFTIVNLISYIRSHNALKSGHTDLVNSLTPVRNIREAEIEGFKKAFKMNLPLSTKVYKHKGVFDYISFKFNHTENKEFSLGGILIHPISYNKLRKKKIGIVLDDYLPDTKTVEEEMKRFLGSHDLENMPEEEVKRKMIALREEAFSHEIEFIFLKEKNLHKQPVFILGIDNWNISRID